VGIYFVETRIFAFSHSLGRPLPVTNGRFQALEFHRPLSGDESEEMTDASRPISACQLSAKQPLSQTQVL